MAKKILPLCVISLGTKGDQLKADQSIQSTGLTIKVNSKALYLSCGFWPDETIILDSGRNAHCSCLGQAGPMDTAVLKEIPRPPVLQHTPHLGCTASPSSASRSHQIPASVPLYTVFLDAWVYSYRNQPESLHRILFLAEPSIKVLKILIIQ